MAKNMKVHTRVVIDLSTWQVLEDDYFEYRGDVSWCKGKGGGSPPPAPDYTGAAITQGKMSNPNISNPFGSQTVTYGADNSANVNQEFSPELQRLFNRPQGDPNSLPSAPINPGQTSQDAMFSRLEPNLTRSREALDVKLANQGIMPGSQAYNTALEQQGQQENDLRLQAASQGIGLDQNARAQALNEQAYYRNAPLQEYSMLKGLMNNTGYDPAPYFQGVQAAGDYNADIYNAKSANRGNITSGLFGLGSSAIQAGGSYFSDRRLKRDIEKIGEVNGFNLYSFRYLWSDQPEIGVMADEVERVIPEAVREVNGFKQVDYIQVLR